MSAPVEDGELSWFKSSYSAANGACVEVAFAGGTVAIRDSKDPRGPVLRVTTDAFKDLIESVRQGSFDLSH